VCGSDNENNLKLRFHAVRIFSMHMAGEDKTRGQSIFPMFFMGLSHIFWLRQSIDEERKNSRIAGTLIFCTHEMTLRKALVMLKI